MADKWYGILCAGRIEGSTEIAQCQKKQQDKGETEYTVKKTPNGYTQPLIQDWE
ncbi:MAG: hypothetical protein NMNS01_02940 [Nitrosomonas sp.]|jgi:hypothetical protein|nr:MAG: hypothetical protein NMNS01_02940 [Nitrosomonas sp.]